MMIGRSVPVPCEAEAVVFIRYDHDFKDWEDFTDDVRGVILERFPSMGIAERRAGDEECVVLENGHAAVVLCQYGGIASVSLVPRDKRGWGLPDEGYNLAVSWCRRVSTAFRSHLTERFFGQAVRYMGTFSNGGSVYERLA
jgi:hypothetical protein